jgi:hypothetical protein
MLRYALNVLVSGACAYLITYFGQERLYRLLVLPVILLGVQSFLNYWWIHRVNPLLVGFLKVIHDQLALPADAHVRITVLRPNTLTNQFRQIARYSATAPHLTNHRFHIHKGVAGLVYRQKAAVYKAIDPAFHRAIMRDLGFTEGEAREFIQKAEYYCVPIFNPEKDVKFVLSLDSDIAGVLTQARQGHVVTFVPYLVSVLLGVTGEDKLAEIARLYGL